MRFTLSLFAAAGILAVATAQDIDFAVFEAAVATAVTSGPPVTATATVQVASYAPSAAAASAKAEAKASPLGGGSNLRRREDTASTSTGCPARPTGSAPVPSPDTPTAFKNDPTYKTFASNAQTPVGYVLSFLNAGGSTSQSGYLGYTFLDLYNPVTCQQFCDQNSDCRAFNIFIERGPSVDPGPTCPNPPSTAYYKCTIWGLPISEATATNTGYYQGDFQAVIAASNGYTKNPAPASLANYTKPAPFGGAIQAPLADDGTDTYMGSRMFAGVYDPGQCAAVCSETTAYWRDRAIHTGASTYQPCNFFNSYVLGKNNVAGGTYCAMYSRAWGQQFATNMQQYDGSGNLFGVSSSYGWTADPVDSGNV